MENMLGEKAKCFSEVRERGNLGREEGGVGEWQKFRPSSRYHASRQIAVRTIPYLTLYSLELLHYYFFTLDWH